MGLRRRVSPPLLLLLSALLVCIRSQDRKSAFAIVGEDFTFSPKVNGVIREISWMRGKNKVAEWEDQGPLLYFSDLRERGALNVSSGNLTIRRLNANDSAEYEAQVLLVGSDQLQYIKFVLEVLAPPSLVLNCSVTDGQINISCKTHFSKNVTYSWNHADMGKVIKADGSVVQFEKNANLPEEVTCIVKVSKTKIDSSISLSACPQERPESLTRSRDGLIAFFVIVFLLLIMVAVFFILWKKGWLNNILHYIPTKQSAAYKIGDQSQEDETFPEENGRKEDEATNTEETKVLFAENHQSGNQSHDIKDEATNTEGTKPLFAESHQSGNQSQDDKDEARNVEETNPLVTESHQSGHQSQDDKESPRKGENTESRTDEARNVEETNPFVAESHRSGHQSQDDEGPATAVLASENENMAGTETGS